RPRSWGSAPPLWRLPASRALRRAARSGRLTPLPAAIDDPQSRRQRGEVGDQREDERGAGDETELPQRGKAGDGERQEARGVDQGREDNRVAGHAQGVRKCIAERMAVALVQVMEEVDLIVLRRPEDGGGDQDR